MVKKYIKLPRISWGKIIRTTGKATSQHECTDAAAAMAFDWVFAIFPGLLVLTALLIITGTPPDAFKQLLVDLGIIIPPTLLGIIEENIQYLWSSYQSLFFFGILGVIWPASASMSTTMSALNRAYDVREKRSFWKRRTLSLVLVVSMGSSLVFLFNLFVFGEQLEAWLHLYWPGLEKAPSLVGLLRRAAGIGGTLIVVACIYRLAPDIKQRWLDVLPGSLLFLLLWSFIAGGFRYFIQSFSYYSVVYGVLGGVMVAFTLLLGGELNGVLFKMPHQEQDGPEG